MSTLQITVVDSKFVSHNGVNIESFAESSVKGNGWEAKIMPDGRLECKAVQYYEGVMHSIMFRIYRRYMKLSLKVGDGSIVILKSCKLEYEWPTNGVIGLPGGYIDTRRPYFRKEEFQKFLETYGITSVRHESANGTYMLIKETKNGEVLYDEKIETDGTVEFVLEDKKNGIRRYEVSNATWVIKTVVEKSNKLRILYTTDNPEKIMNLPKPS